MCDYTQVQYKCTHVRYVVKAWCTKYQQTHVRCPANVTAVYEEYPFLMIAQHADILAREYRLNENCGSLIHDPNSHYDMHSNNIQRRL